MSKRRRENNADITPETTTTDNPSDKFDGNKICLDNVSEESVNDAKAAMTRAGSVVISANPTDANDEIQAYGHESQYSNFLAVELDGVLRRQWPNWTWTQTGHLQDLTRKQQGGRFDAQIGGKACTLRVVRERSFGEKYCANFLRYTAEVGKPDISLEVFEPQTGLSNAVAMIEVKNLILSETDRNKGFQQLVSYLVTRVRPIKRDQHGWLLRGLLLSRAEGFLVTLRSKEWLDYPWECVQITHYAFNNFILGVREVLRRYVEETVHGQTNADQLFKWPKDLTFPHYPNNVEHLAKNANVIKCKWRQVSNIQLRHGFVFPQTATVARFCCRFSKLPLPGEMDVVLKVVSPTVYKHDDPPGQIGTILAVLHGFLVTAYYISNDDTVSNEAKQRLSALNELYQHIGARGACSSSCLVVTAYRGQPICSIPRLAEEWRDVAFRKRFFCEVCLTAFDVVTVLAYTHTDLRPANIVFDGGRFTIIDWENVRSVLSTQTAVSGKPKAKEADATQDAQQEEMDERYPKVSADNHSVRWLVFSACQLYMCIYIIDKAAQGVNANEVEREFRRGGGFWRQPEQLSWPDAVNDFAAWRGARRFGDLQDFMMTRGIVDDAMCRSVLEGILQCALGI